MIKCLKVTGFKSLTNENLSLKPLTVITGVNSSGKSAVIQSLQLLLRYSHPHNDNSMAALCQNFGEFSAIRNKYTNAKRIELAAETDFGYFSLTKTREAEETQSSAPDKCWLYEPKLVAKGPELHYLSANRVGQESVSVKHNTHKVGANGEYLFAAFDRSKSQPLVETLCRFTESRTLSFQVSRWLTEITGQKTELNTESINESQVKISYEFAGIPDINPFNLGAGVSFAAKIVLLCLLAKPGDIVMIENPEIHLHPKAQAILGVFFTFIASAGIQLIIETHSEHMINKIRHQVFSQQFNADGVVFHYKGGVNEPFISLDLNFRGCYLNKDESVVGFPRGFFDSTLEELFEIGG